MDCEHAGETFALGETGGAFEAGRVAEIGVEGFDRIDAGGLRRDQAERAYDLVGEQEFTVLAPIGGGTQPSLQVFALGRCTSERKTEQFRATTNSDYQPAACPSLRWSDPAR